MSTTLPVTTILQCGKVAQYLASNDIAKQNGLFNGALNPMLPILIYMERSIVQWQYDINPTDTTLTESANYLWQLYGKYGKAALNIVVNGSTGGGVIPSSGTAPTPLQFVVSGSSIIPAGSSSVTIASFIGFNLLFSRGGVNQTTIDTEQSYYTWNRTTGAFSCYPSAFTDEVFQLFPI